MSGERIAEVLKAHQWWFVGNLGVPGMEDSKDYKCACGWTAGGGIGVGKDPNEHVAAAVLAALNLTEEWRAEGDCRDGDDCDHFGDHGHWTSVDSDNRADVESWPVSRSRGAYLTSRLVSDWLPVGEGKAHQ